MRRLSVPAGQVVAWARAAVAVVVVVGTVGAGTLPPLATTEVMGRQVLAVVRRVGIGVVVTMTALAGTPTALLRHQATHHWRGPRVSLGRRPSRWGSPPSPGKPNPLRATPPDVTPPQLSPFRWGPAKTAAGPPTMVGAAAAVLPAPALSLRASPQPPNRLAAVPTQSSYSLLEHSSGP